MLYSYACMNYLLYYYFILIISTDVYCHMFTAAHVTLDLKSQATGIALRILLHADVVPYYSRSAWVWHSRRLAVVGPVS